MNEAEASAEDSKAADLPSDDTLFEENAAGEDWPLRPWLLAAIGALAGLLVYELLDSWDDATPEAWRPALAAFFFFCAAAAGFTLRPSKLVESALFSLGLGVVMAGITWLAANAVESRAATEYAFAAGVFFSILAIPLFQAEFHKTRWATPYPLTHFHVWTDAVSAGGAFLFSLLSWALLWLLDGLFSLIGISFIEDLIETGWFIGFYFGATFGAALGVLRNQQSIIGTLQRVVMLVFALLAVPFGFAILIFLVILLFSGGSALWDATSSATPVLLTCAVFCFILVNAVVRDDDASRSGSVVMQAAALVLAVCILPLTVFAAISMGIRIDQHGLAPERIWALIAIAISTAYGLAYWVGIARGRVEGWSAYLRRANLHLAVVTCGIALFLALPILDFGAISTRDQLARLESGEVAPSEFDYAALRWDFGDAGREALAQLAESDDETIAYLAQTAQAQIERPYIWDREDFAERATEQTFVVYPEGSDLPSGLRAAIANSSFCPSETICRVYLQQDGETAVALRDGCAAADGEGSEQINPRTNCYIETRAYERREDGWRPLEGFADDPMTEQEEAAALRREREAIESGNVRIERSQQRSIFIGDKETGRPFR